MILSERQTHSVLKMFVSVFAAANADQRKDVYLDFADSFFGSISNWEDTISAAFSEAETAPDIIMQWQKIEAERKEAHTKEVCEIDRMNAADEKEIVGLLARELDCMPCFAGTDTIGTVKDFAATGFSFVAKKNQKIIGVIMAQKVMDYGTQHVFINNFAVTASMQGKGIGKQLLNRLIQTARAEHIHKIMLHTQKKLKAYDVYHHIGFEDQEEEAIYLTKWVY